MSKNTALLASALEYAARGWHVFPLIPGTKKPATPRHRADQCDGTDPRCRAGHTGWEQRATTDLARITRAWTGDTAWGIGIACGPSGLLVIDTDTDTDGDTGEAVILALASAHGSLPPTWTVSTPSGGIHRYYTQPAAALGNTARRLGALVDTRGVGGYVVAPPTRTSTGRYDTVVTDPVADLPGWLVGLLTSPPLPPADSRIVGPDPAGAPPVTDRYVTAAITGETAKIRQAPPGTRNQQLFLSAIALGQIVGAGLLDHHRAAAALMAAADTHLTARAYTPREAASTIASGLARGTGEPRRTEAA